MDQREVIRGKRLAGSFEQEIPHLSTPLQAKPQKIVCSIRLNPGISTLNFVCSQINYMIMVFAFGITDTLQPLILLDKSYYNIDRNHAGGLLALILFFQLLIKMSVSIIYGFASDKFGRKPVLYFGLCSLTAGLILAPCFDEVFPGFMLAKLFVSNGCTAIAILPFNGDYIHDESKGKAAGVTVTLNAVGALLSNLFLKVLISKEYNLQFCYWVSAAIIFVAFAINTIGLKGGRYYLEKHEDEGALIPQPESQETTSQRIKDALRLFRENGWLSIALILQILGNSDFYLAFTVLTLYIKSMFPEGTDDKVSNIAVNNVQTVLFIPTLVSNVFYGYYIDRTNKVINVIILALTGGAAGFLMMSLASSPYDFLLYAAAALSGASITGIYVSSNYLCFTHYPKDKRGLMLGITLLVAYFGYVIIASGGGFLFDHWRHNAPFLMYTAISVIALIWVWLIYTFRLSR